MKYYLTALALLFTLLVPQTANAWSGDLNACSVSLPTDWQAQIKNRNGGTNPFNTIDFTTQQIVIGTEISDTTENLTVFISDAGSQFETNSGTTTYNYNGAYGQYNKFNTSTNSLTAYGGDIAGQKNFSCIVSAQNETYATGYVGKNYNNTAQTKPLKDETCQPLDILCQISFTMNGISDTFTAVGDALLRGIAMLFLPSPSDFTQLFTTTYNIFSDQFGLLLSPFTFIYNTFNRLVTAVPYGSPSGGYGNADCGIQGGTSSGDGECVYGTSNLTFTGTFFGQPVHLNMSAMEDKFPTMWYTVSLIIRATTISLIMFGIYKRYVHIIDGAESKR